MSTEDIVQVGREAARRAYEDVPGDDIFLITAEAVIAAVRPLIEARQRARASAAIRRLGETPQIDGALVLPLHPLVLDYIEAAARIAETDPEESS